MSQLVASLDSTRAFPAVAPPLPAGILQVDVLRNLHLRPDDEAALDRLVEGHPQVGVFVSKPWLSGFFADPQAGADQAILLLRGDGVLRAIVPIAVRETLTHVRVSILGGGLGSDRVDLLAARGFEAVAADTFIGWLRDTFGAKGYVLELRDVCGNSALWGAIHRSGIERTQRLVLQPREIYTLPYLPLGNRSASAADAPSTRSLRSVEKHRRWLERRCHLRIDLLDDLTRITEAFESLVHLLSARWRGKGEGSALDDPRMVRFHRHVLPLLFGAGRLRMMRMTAESRTVAVFYGLAAGGWWGYYLAGYDREWAGRIHLGQVNLAAAIALAKQSGADEFDFLKGAERVKYTWPVLERTAIDADVFSGNSGVQLTRVARATRDATAALTKSARALFS